MPQLSLQTYSSKRINKKLRLCTALLFLASLSLSNTSMADTFVIAFGKDPSTNSQHLFYKKIYEKAFLQLGYDFEYVLCPSKRCSVMADSGKVDGEPQRVRSYNTRFKNMIRVDEPIFINRTIAFSKNKQLKIEGLESLAQEKLRVDYLMGSVWSRENLSRVLPADYLTAIKTSPQSLKRIMYGRVDIFVALEAPTLELLDRKEYRDSGIIPAGIIGQNESFPFIHNSHIDLAPKLAETLQKMKASGEYQRILREVMPYLKHQETQIERQNTAGQ